MKCHLCKNELTEASGPLWSVGNRRRVVLACYDRACSSIKVVNRCWFDVILPEWDVIRYRLLVSDKGRWYRIESRHDSDTLLSELDVGYPGAEGHEKIILSAPKFYPIPQDADLPALSSQIVNKLKRLIVFS